MEQYGEKVREVLEKLLDENPQHSQLIEKMKSRLAECGWKDEVRLECNKIIQKRGIENIYDPDEIVKEITPAARSKVPMELKKELVSMLKNALMQELEGTDMKP